MDANLTDIAIVAGAAIISAGLTYIKTKAKYQKAKKMLKDLVTAIDDDKITEPEAAQLIQDAKDIIA